MGTSEPIIKTKAQLRAEAVERLRKIRDSRYPICNADIGSAIANGNIDNAIDLLTDDEPDAKISRMESVESVSQDSLSDTQENLKATARVLSLLTGKERVLADDESHDAERCENAPENHEDALGSVLSENTDEGEDAETAQGYVDDEIIYGFEFCGKPDSTMLGETVFDSVGEPIGWIVANGVKGNCGHDADGKRLKPCPWCGGEADLVEMETKCDGMKFWKVSCNDCRCMGANVHMWHKTESEAIEVWNTRAETVGELGITYTEDGAGEQFKAMQDRIDTLEAALKGERNDFYQAMESRKHWQREYKSLKVESETYRDGMHAQARRVGELMAERDMYRDKLGRAIDAAHEITRMVDESWAFWKVSR